MHMSGGDLTGLLQSMTLLSLFLIIGMVLRAKIKIFQNTFLPASVIGGFLLLILGPQVLNVIPIPESWSITYASMPGVLIIPVVAAVPLGLSLKENGGRTIEVAKCFWIMLLATGVQLAVGFGVHLGFGVLGTDLYDGFGWELNMGFAGGHGSAGTLANLLEAVGADYWETAQGVAITMATIGLVGGILIGMFLINVAARKGYTHFLDKPGAIPADIRIGYEKDPAKQKSAGKETTHSSSIDVLAFHLALILVVCGVSYMILNACKAYKIPILSSLSVWAFAMAIMFIVWYVMCKTGVDYLVDGKIKGRITGTMTEYAVIAAVSSLNLKTVSAYLAPMLVMAVIGMIATWAILWYTSKWTLKDDWFEHMIAMFGMNTGVFLTGILLLRIADPDSKSCALADYSLAYTICGLVTFALMPTYAQVISAQGPVIMFLYAVGIAAVSLVAVILTGKLKKA